MTEKNGFPNRQVGVRHGASLAVGETDQLSGTERLRAQLDGPDGVRTTRKKGKERGGRGGSA